MSSATMPSVKKLDSLVALLKAPPVEYRPAPQWSWNGDLSEEHIRQRLQQFADQGIGGMFAHARTNFITGYISDRFFELWDFAAREAQRLGMQFHIYDEFCCPSGNAAGQVVAEKPHLARQELAITVFAGVGPRPTGEPLAYFRVENGTPVLVPSPDGATPGQPVFALTLRRVSGKAGFGGMPDNDLLRREATDAFIACTHEGYARRSKDLFGTAIKFMFSDEPYISGHNTGLPMSRDLLREFYADHGYELTDHLAALCFAQEGYEAVRFDYFSTINRLFNDNFMRPMHDWCEANNLLFTGHLMEHEWPSPISHPDAMASMRWMHAPGNDLLGFQFESTTLAQNGIYLLNLKELASLTNQLGREWTMVESAGAQGYHAAYELFKPCEDWLLCHGVNVMDPHLSHETLAGYSKYDWPQTLSEHSPWWQYYRHHADHIARANAILSQGREYNRVLVLHPTTTAWMYYEHPIFRTVLPGQASGQGKMDLIRDSQVDLLVSLTGAQVDYDLGDEFLLAEFGRAKDGKLRISDRAYDLVIVPPAMENWTTTTLKLMGEYLATGGRVLAMTIPTRVNGRANSGPAELAKRYPKQWIQVETTSDVIRVVRNVVPPYLCSPDGSPLPGGIAWRRAVMSDGDAIWFFSNPWGQEISAEIRLPGSAAIDLDTTHATTAELPSTQSDGHVTVKLTLAPRGHALLYVPQGRLSGVPQKAQRTAGALIALGKPSIQRLDDNILTLDYCDPETRRGKLTDVATIHGDAQNWKWQGFDGSPWRGGYQFKQTIIDRPVPGDTSFMVQYRFTIATNLPASALQALRVGIERPWLYRITLNGQELRDPKPWFDEAMRAFAIGQAARPGENVLSLECHPMHMLAQIMPVYLLGDFAAVPTARGFELGPTGELQLGRWSTQGLGFYPGHVRYTFPFTLQQPAEMLDLQLGEWAGPVAAIRVDGREQGVIMHPPYRLGLPGPFPAGNHELAIDVVGNMRNMMGPHHADGLAGPWTWDRCPAHQPAGSQYKNVPTGLLAVPVLRPLA